jgi:para-nitrobenzyl esterase
MKLRLFLLATLFVAVSCAQVGPQDTSQGLGGTSWQVVRFQGGDGKVVIPGDGTLYTLAFEKDGYVVMRIDCNRGRGTWKSDGKSQIEFGPMALTRAMCPQGSMHDQVVKQLPNIRSYVVRNGRLFLSLMADGGTYELAPAR